MDDIAAGHVFREGLDTRGVETGIGLGETEGNLILTRDKTRHPPGLLLVSALYDDRMRAEKIDVDRRWRRHATAMTRDFVHHRSRFGDTETRPAGFFGHRDTEPATMRHPFGNTMQQNAAFLTPTTLILLAH